MRARQAANRLRPAISLYCLPPSSEGKLSLETMIARKNPITSTEFSRPLINFVLAPAVDFVAALAIRGILIEFDSDQLDVGICRRSPRYGCSGALTTVPAIQVQFL